MNYDASFYFDMKALECDINPEDIIRYKAVLDGLLLPVGGIETNKEGMNLDLRFDWIQNEIGCSKSISGKVIKESKQIIINIFRTNSNTNESVHYYIKSFPNGYNITIHLSDQNNKISGIYYIEKNVTSRSLVEESISYYDLEACNRVVPNNLEYLNNGFSDLSFQSTLEKLYNSYHLFTFIGIYPDIYFRKDIEGYSNDASLEIAKELNQYIKNSDIESTFKYCNNILDNNERRTSNFVLSLN